MKYTPQILIDKLIEYCDRYAKLPTIKEINANPEYPSSSTYIYHFGSWNNALDEMLLYRSECLPKNTSELKYSADNDGIIYCTILTPTPIICNPRTDEVIYSGEATFSGKPLTFNVQLTESGQYYNYQKGHYVRLPNFPTFSTNTELIQLIPPNDVYEFLFTAGGAYTADAILKGYIENHSLKY